jgi:hypothetical protein
MPGRHSPPQRQQPAGLPAQGPARSSPRPQAPAPSSSPAPPPHTPPPHTPHLPHLLLHVVAVAGGALLVVHGARGAREVEQRALERVRVDGQLQRALLAHLAQPGGWGVVVGGWGGCWGSGWRGRWGRASASRLARQRLWVAQGWWHRPGGPGPAARPLPLRRACPAGAAASGSPVERVVEARHEQARHLVAQEGEGGAVQLQAQARRAVQQHLRAGRAGGRPERRRRTRQRARC